MDLFDLGVCVRQVRRRKGYSMQALADMAGVDRSTLSKLENQRLPELGYGKVVRLLAVLELELIVRPASPLPTLPELLRDMNRE
ncbi:helix-turn-helix domain-containing protein [Nitrincola alkalilacustris]|uniref:helix-turn-helix domain-containing protein n=1 Tax=Nitrincola alkalilacustris TaxID=1571224 RepID=UPI00124E7E74|nr:helix-turn-helix transcriptional regulator [Nitrincola alkalilacustris]